MYETIDEAYNSIEVKNVYSVSDNQIMHLKHEHSIAYNYQIDEGIGASIKDEGSLPDVAPAHSHLDAMSEADADGELEEDTEVIPEPLSDTEYTPKRSRARKARSPRASPQYHPLKSGRIHKSSSKARGNVICKQCEHAPFKDTTALQRHITSSHTRAFICVFNFAGCGATFTSKNEWKRHVSSQHLNLTAWVCDIGTCGKNNSSGKSKPAEFNRKDLFTQHLRRMHTPFQVKRNKDKKNLEWEEKLKDLQKECLVMKREPPMQLACPLPGCGAYFEGQGTWDDRMEHVGKHLEKAAAGVGECVRQEDDALLVEWAAREGILMRKPGFSGWRLCVDNGNGKKDEDRDADGEEEFL
ncbi:putative PR domain zinc finger protein 10 [Glarea lozoyensis 74030]|nr:putative PR domain zinc finger protein 10 [Glarea lozoyensis 74030]